VRHRRRRHAAGQRGVEIRGCQRNAGDRVDDVVRLAVPEDARVAWEEERRIAAGRDEDEVRGAEGRRRLDARRGWRLDADVRLRAVARGTISPKILRLNTI